ncbi:LPD1 domain-containing protein [Lysinibacillus sp. NPDC093712]|uniref:LPD1 domain-containing protein n=1 Tax=Lysinibacillus sp. NPDC093712 TaxID=3390579 RepID=UPI003D028F94
MSQQLDLFMSVEEDIVRKGTTTFPMYKPMGATLDLTKVLDVRTQVQKKRKVSFDVGAKIGGAPKDLEEKRNLFKLSPNVGLLEEIAAEDEVIADGLAKKTNIFNWFSLDKCQENGVDIHAAYGMSLLIRRVPSDCSKLSMNRRQYINLLIKISETLKDVRTIEHLFLFLSRMQTLISTDRLYHYTIRKLETLKGELEKLSAEPIKNEVEIKKLSLDQQHLLGCLNVYDLGTSIKFNELKSIVDLLTSQNKLREFNKSIKKYATWEQYNKENKLENKANVKKGSSKPVWERKLPSHPRRTSDIFTPEMNVPAMFKEYFGFRAIEFGNWVEDSIGEAHLNNAAKAFTDLAELLAVTNDKISLGRELAIAFGARGKGRALGHYESGYNVINLTKERGSLGILAHEWFHAFDCYLKKKFAPEYGGLLTAGAEVFMLPTEIFMAYHQLMDSIKMGTSTAYIDVKGFKGSYRLTSKFISQYEKHMGNLHETMDSLMREFDEQVKRHLIITESEKGRQAIEEKYLKKRKKTLRTNAEALSQLHKERTGQEEYHIPYTSNQTQFYRNAIDLDRGKEGKYYSSNVELCARSFESFIFTLLNERNWRSDYLVSGIDEEAFPKGEEKEKIQEAVGCFIQATVPYL